MAIHVEECDLSIASTQQILLHRCCLTVILRLVYNACLMHLFLSRYSYNRKQFGPIEGGEELPVIEYQMQQWRLFPYLASAYIWHTFSVWFSSLFYGVSVQRFMGKETDPEFEVSNIVQ